MKKIIAALLTLITVFNIFVISFAEDYEDTTDNTVCLTEEISEDFGTGIEDTVNPFSFETEEQSVESQNKTVAEIYLCSTVHSVTGHMWIYVTNTSDSDIEVGYLTVEPGKSVSVGNFGPWHKAGGGTYYNGEALMAKNPETTSKHTTYLKQSLTKESLLRITKEIIRHNTYFFIGYNCTNFACDVWNAAARTKVASLCLPALTTLEMLLFGGRTGNPTMDNTNQVYKQTGNIAKALSEDPFVFHCVG